MIKEIVKYIQQDIWRFRTKTLGGLRGLLLRTLRILTLSFREFSTDQCSLRASALTFFSLLSIVPVLAMSFGLAKGFGLEKLLREKLVESLAGQRDVLAQAITFAENLLQNTKGGLIAGVGLVLLFWTVIKVLGSIETAFNHIWGIKKDRGLGRKFTDYLALMMIVPVLYIVASSATVFVTSQISLVTNRFGMIGPFVLLGLKILPFAVFSGLLTYLYIFMPNGKIRFGSALLGGLVAGSLYQGLQWAYIHFQIGASSAGAIYGSFAALPLFLAWLQTSWVIVLYGAELAFAHQNEQTFEFEPDCLSASPATKKLLALRLAHLCVTRFSKGLPALSIEEIAAHLEMPIRLARDLLHRLAEAGLLTLIQGQDERDRRYQPALDVGEMTIQFVIEKLDETGTRNIPVAETSELEKLRASLAAFERAVTQLPDNRLLKDL